MATRKILTENTDTPRWKECLKKRSWSSRWPLLDMSDMSQLVHTIGDISLKELLDSFAMFMIRSSDQKNLVQFAKSNPWKEILIDYERYIPYIEGFQILCENKCLPNILERYQPIEKWSPEKKRILIAGAIVWKYIKSKDTTPKEIDCLMVLESGILPDRIPKKLLESGRQWVRECVIAKDTQSPMPIPGKLWDLME